MHLNNYSLDVESVSVFKTHLISLLLIFISIAAIIKWVLPKLLEVYKQKLDIESKKLDAEKEIIKTTLIRWSESQEKVNTAIVTQLDYLKNNMSEIKEFIRFTTKISSMLILFIFGCDSDTITVYKFKQPVYEVDKQLQVKEDFKPCSEKCPPGKECDTTTGKCKEISKPATKVSNSPGPVSDLNLLMYTLTSR